MPDILLLWLRIAIRFGSRMKVFNDNFTQIVDNRRSIEGHPTCPVLEIDFKTDGEMLANCRTLPIIG